VPPVDPTAATSPSGPPAAALDRAGEVVLGRWRVERPLGAGALGEVWRARDEAGGAAAVKILHGALAGDAALAARFVREARVARRLAHPAVPAVYADGRTGDGRPAIVMELVEGVDLGARIARGGPLPVAEALRVGERVAAVLDDAHAHGVVHRDVKPPNVMLAGGAVRVLDFGVALVADEPRLTASGVVVGTPWYLSPEQCRGEPATPASDLYALGATLVHALTGEPLYPDVAGPAQLLAHLETPAPRLRDRRPDVPAAVEALVASLVEKDPARRPLSARAAADALGALARWAEGLAAEPPPGARLLGAEVARLRHEVARARRQAAEAEARVVDEIIAATARWEAEPDDGARAAQRARVEGLERALERLREGARAREGALRDELACAGG